MIAVISVGVLVMLMGLLLIWVSARMWQGRLPRNSIAGVRTRSSMRSDAAFQVANKAAAPFAVIGGVFFMAAGLACAILPPSAGGPALLAGAVAAAVVCTVGGIRGSRACR